MAHFSFEALLGEPSLEECPGEGVERRTIGVGLEGGHEGVGSIERAPGQCAEEPIDLDGAQSTVADEDLREIAQPDPRAAVELRHTLEGRPQPFGRRAWIESQDGHVGGPQHRVPDLPGGLGRSGREAFADKRFLALLRF